MHPEAEQIKERMASLSTPAGFANEWFKLVGAGYSHLKAWEKLESEFFDLFGRNYFSSFDSFRVSKNRLLKKPYANHRPD